ncbi:alpha/beta hydrolase-fold protein [uncultured Psychroserpens sp.]|uniref:alpha/beta hydrolase n=1 Tax=uncultured Psychroserpens sp. TaxID=255436 RepID=UPI00261F65E8|nr:alpha/beta hydrolase-fold protein [uncultured Psychroserpens sp.]
MKTLIISITILLFGVFLVCAQSTASKQVSTFVIEAPQIKTHKMIWVYLPKSYSISKKNYPVIYMFDAQNLFDDETSYIGEWKIDEYLDTLKTKEAIIIGIEHGNEKRFEELTPYKNEKYSSGKGDDFLNFIMHTLKPHVDTIYRTKADASHTSVIGASLGGLMAFYATLKYPEVFGSSGVFSASFWINPEIYDAIQSNTTLSNDDSKFFFLIGSEEGDEMVHGQEQIIQLLKEKGINEERIKNKVVPGGTHNETLWSTNFPEVFNWLIPN